MEKVSIAAPGGACPTYVWNADKQPSVLVFMDGVGMRPAIRDVAAAIAERGYRVVMPDMFYRLGEYTAPAMADTFGNPEVGKAWWGKVMGIMTPANVIEDLAAYVAYMGERPFGVTGYCMGGRFAFTLAGLYPDRVAAAGSYHPGGLVTDDATSPHLLANKIKAKLFIAAAKDDANFTDAQKATLSAALSAAHVDFQLETFDAKHGWVPTDSPVHDAAEAARHFDTLFALLDRSLRT